MAQIDMAAIREAIARRQGGGATAPLDQVTSPQAVLPTGGPNTPTVPPTPAPTPTPGQAPLAPQGPQAPQTGQPPKPSLSFDDETKNLAKQLISKLMSAL